MYISRKALKLAGLDVNLDKSGLSIQGQVEFPESVKDAIGHITKSMEFTPYDEDRLINHVGNTSVWNALRRCPTEV